MLGSRAVPHDHAAPARAPAPADAESARLDEDARRTRNWKRWGPYLAERQWGTVREDYSADGDAWAYFPHDHARSRAYRWGEDGLLGVCDRQGRLCFALALWNERDPILKERLFGLTNPQGNHGEDVKELYYYLDATPTHSWLQALYKYPQAEFPYARLVEENGRRGRDDPELDLLDTGVFDGDRYFDVLAEYAKAGPDDLCIRVTVQNRGPAAAALHVLPTLWFRNTWSWGRTGEGYWPRPRLWRDDGAATRVYAEHAGLGRWVLEVGAGVAGEPAPEELLFTDNETNRARLWGAPDDAPFVKDAFHDHVVHGRAGAVNPAGTGTKAAAHYRLVLPPGGREVLRLRLRAAGDADTPTPSAAPAHDEVLAARRAEADAFYASRIPAALGAEERRVARQAYAGLCWSKQFFHLVVAHWLEGDPAQPPPPATRARVRNGDWGHLYNRDVVSMPDKWEYPWYAAWDLAFHMVPFARIDPAFAKQQLLLFLREWYMHPNGQIPAYEYALGDVNPPVHAWAAWRIYKMSGPRGARDLPFLKRVFNKLLLNFTWWVNRKDPEGRNLFAGGFLGLDNIGVFDRSRPLPTGGHLEQADGTAWMAFFCATMLSMSLELAREEPEYEDMASKFFEHFLAIVDAMNTLGGTGLWDEADGFYYDELNTGGGVEIPLRIRSMVGLLPLIAVEVLEDEAIARLPGFAKRMRWFTENRPDLARHMDWLPWADGGAPSPAAATVAAAAAAAAPDAQAPPAGASHGHRLLAIASRERLVRVLRYLLDEEEFLSPFGVRSLSRVHRAQPYVFRAGGEEYRVEYEPGESNTGLFGGNSNWRGPVWFPVNYLLIEALERYHHFYGDGLKVECPTGSGRLMALDEVAHEIARRLTALFLPDAATGARPCHGRDAARYAADPSLRDLVLFFEYFDGDTGRGCGASHQTGWTALVVRCLEDLAQRRAGARAP
jgi:hypothetical protein